MIKKIIIAVVLVVAITVLSVGFLQSFSNQATDNATAKANSFELQIKNTIAEAQSKLPYTYVVNPNDTEINYLLSTADFNVFATVSESTFLNYVNESNNNGNGTLSGWVRLDDNGISSGCIRIANTFYMVTGEYNLTGNFYVDHAPLIRRVFVQCTPSGTPYHFPQ
jgi:FlaG/FlaF family flagellin (archaellin)